MAIMKKYINIIDLDIYIQNAKLKENYRLLFEEYRRMTFQVRALSKELDVLKAELIDVQLRFNRMKWTENKSEEDMWR